MQSIDLLSDSTKNLNWFVPLSDVDICCGTANQLTAVRTEGSPATIHTCISSVFVEVFSQLSSIDQLIGCSPFTWIDGNTYTTNNNTATHTLTNINGCDSIVTLDLTIANPNSGADFITACDSYTWIDGITYTSSNSSATYTLTNAAGCDSLVHLFLDIKQSYDTNEVHTACDTFTWTNGITYGTSTNTTQSYINSQGCDSIISLDLTIYNSTYAIDQHNACNSFSWIDGNTYTSSNDTAKYILTNAVGCDSVVTLNLNIIPDVDLGPDTIAVCNQNYVELNAGSGYSYYNWSTGSPSQSYNVFNSGMYWVNVGSSNCQSKDSIYVIFDTIINSYLYITSFGDYTLNGITYTQSGNYTQTLNSVYGCDSIINLSLFVEVGMDELLQNAIEVLSLIHIWRCRRRG